MSATHGGVTSSEMRASARDGAGAQSLLGERHVRYNAGNRRTSPTLNAKGVVDRTGHISVVLGIPGQPYLRLLKRPVGLGQSALHFPRDGHDHRHARVVLYEAPSEDRAARSARAIPSPC